MSCIVHISVIWSFGEK